MKICNYIFKFIKNPYKIIPYLGRKGMLNWVKDDVYLKLAYKGHMKQTLDLKNPKTFNEKLQWLKLYDRKDIYTKLVDKYNVREYISQMIGEEYLIPLIGVYDCFDDINFNELPEQFVLKCTHDSGGVVICKDKANFDISKARLKINKSMKRNFYYVGREWPYKNIKPKVICEKYMVDESGTELKDYKFMCFHGDPKVIQYHYGRFENHRQYLYDLEGNILPFNNLGYTNEGAPKLDMSIIEKMIPIAKKLSKDLNQIRVDFYFINGKVYFGELTFFDASGFEKIVPEKYDYLLGSWIDLPMN